MVNKKTDGDSPKKPYLHVEDLYWMLKDLSKDERLAWLFEEKCRPFLKYGEFFPSYQFIIYTSN